MKFVKSTVALTIGALLTSGCSSLQLSTDRNVALRLNDGKPVVDTNEVKKMIDDAGWSEPALIQSKIPAITLVAPSLPPKSIQNKTIELSMEPGSTIRDLAAALGAAGFSLVLADNEAANKEIFIPKYKGKLGGLLKVVSKASDVFFLWQGDSLYVSSKEKIGMSVPQDFYAGIKSFYSLLETDKKSEARVTTDQSQQRTDSEGKVIPEAKSLAENIAYQMLKMGILDVQASQEAGFVSFSASHNQMEALKTYLDRTISNAAVVSLQVLVVNVQLEKDNKRGVDWERLNATFGSQPGVLMSNLLSGGLNGAVAQMPSDTAQDFYNRYGLVNGQAGGFGLQGGRGEFNVNAFINALDKYGRAEAMQNAVMKTVTGSEVVLDSASRTPYVERVEVSTAGQSGAQAQSVITNSARDGLFMKLKPLYDASSGIVTIDAGISLDNVLRLVDLNAGGLGRLSQPVTSQRRFNSVMRLKPGQTAVVGGLIYETGDASQKGISNLPGTANELDRRIRNEMFIVIRPTVETLGRVAVASNMEDEPEDFMSELENRKNKVAVVPVKEEAIKKAMSDMTVSLKAKNKKEIKTEFEKAAKELEVSDQKLSSVKMKIGELVSTTPSVQAETSKKEAKVEPKAEKMTTSVEPKKVNTSNVKPILSTDGQYLKLNAYRMRIRSESTLDSSTVGFLKQGIQVQIVERIEGSNRVKIAVNGRVLGWVTESYFSKV